MTDEYIPNITARIVGQTGQIRHYPTIMAHDDTSNGLCPEADSLEWDHYGAPSGALRQ